MKPGQIKNFKLEKDYYNGMRLTVEDEEALGLVRNIDGISRVGKTAFDSLYHVGVSRIYDYDYVFNSVKETLELYFANKLSNGGVDDGFILGGVEE